MAESSWGYIINRTIGTILDWDHDKSPHIRSFSANRYVVDTIGHSAYWTPNSTSLKNQAAVIAGLYITVSLEHGEAPENVS
ncbi:hypothetical protein Areg01_81210 [Actinoplanes regularis]|nr:hypothetical protein Areg01_81210 [Actinoplanes regularis]